MDLESCCRIGSSRRTMARCGPTTEEAQAAILAAPPSSDCEAACAGHHSEWQGLCGMWQDRARPRSAAPAPAGQVRRAAHRAHARAGSREWLLHLLARACSHVFRASLVVRQMRCTHEAASAGSGPCLQWAAYLSAGRVATKAALVRSASSGRHSVARWRESHCTAVVRLARTDVIGHSRA